MPVRRYCVHAKANEVVRRVESKYLFSIKSFSRAQPAHGMTKRMKMLVVSSRLLSKTVDETWFAVRFFVRFSRKVTLMRPQTIFYFAICANIYEWWCHITMMSMAAHSKCPFPHITFMHYKGPKCHRKRIYEPVTIKLRIVVRVDFITLAICPFQ